MLDPPLRVRDSILILVHTTMSKKYQIVQKSNKKK
jgi:hypothetical protein